MMDLEGIEFEMMWSDWKQIGDEDISISIKIADLLIKIGDDFYSILSRILPSSGSTLDVYNSLVEYVGGINPEPVQSTESE